MIHSFDCLSPHLDVGHEVRSLLWRDGVNLPPYISQKISYLSRKSASVRLEQNGRAIVVCMLPYLD